MPAEVHQFLCLSDNFGVLVHDAQTGATAAIDCPDGAPYLAALAEKGWKLTDILITHRHGDHIDGVPALREAFPEAKLYLPAKEAERIVETTGPADAVLNEGDVVKVGSLGAEVIETPGHTAGHIVYYFPVENLLFAGDTLFALGCGRVFETSMTVMWESLVKLASLPGETRVYCGHEYTQANGRFALTVDSGNSLLIDRMREVDEHRTNGVFTLPTTIELELTTNPFLRAENPEVQENVGLKGADPAAVFAELRERKNKA
ncbi:MAG: gloB [Hyphomicrobiales bacterium]|nr:gloB [Hyphomicrobiales bacterium]